MAQAKRLLANGEPIVFKDNDADKILEKLRFTVVMICVVTALDTFITLSTITSILESVLKELLRPTE